MTFTLLPLAVGMVLRRTFPRFAEQADRADAQGRALPDDARTFARYRSRATGDILTYFASAGALVLAMNLLTMGLGFGLARSFSAPDTASRHDHLRGRRAKPRSLVRDHVQYPAAARSRRGRPDLCRRDAGDRTSLRFNRATPDPRAILGRCSRLSRPATRRAALLARYQSVALASRAPATSDSSFAHMTEGCTRR